MTRPRKVLDTQTCQAALRWWREEGSPAGHLSNYMQRILDVRVGASEAVSELKKVRPIPFPSGALGALARAGAEPTRTSDT